MAVRKRSRSRNPQAFFFTHRILALRLSEVALVAPARVVPSARSTALGTQQGPRAAVLDARLHLRPQLHIANQPRRGLTEYRRVEIIVAHNLHSLHQFHAIPRNPN